MKFEKTYRALSSVGICCALAIASVRAQQIPLPQNLPQEHPRLLVKDSEKERVKQIVAAEPWAQQVLAGIKKRVDPHVNRHVADPQWMPSRLMMYWNTKATEVYIKGGAYSHAGGEPAPVPTVRFAASRAGASTHGRPKLEDILPYMDDPRGLYFHNNQAKGRPLEWVEQSKTSGIESINNEIIGYGSDAAFLYWLTGEERYAKFAYDLFDTFMMGIYYRNEPIDLNNGHTQTLVGMTYFEVIQERILNTLSAQYDFLFGYLKSKHADKMTAYAAAFKKWIDLTIKNGVPQNNWNLHQAKIILSVAMILEDNARYPDGKGREYYIDYILNRTSPRQWSLTRFMEYGYDPATGAWNECPGYAQGVTADLAAFIVNFDNTFNYNLLPHMPVVKTAVSMLPQYLFPNGHITAFGDTHYSPLRTSAMADLIRIAQKHGDRETEREFTAMYKLFEPQANDTGENPVQMAPQVSSLFAGSPLTLDRSIEKAALSEYVTPTFYAPNASWFVQRNGMDPQTGLMISQYASEGNHMHSNGIAVELYGKGYVLGAESGIGTNYFQPDYLEYYSQFPAHNTVMVDGISKYPEMLSHHGFDLLSCYPAPGQKSGSFPGITYSNTWFLEPESRSDQNRFLSIVRTGETSGYYIDIFRSAKQRGGDKFHDYFYHNLGQEMSVSDAAGAPLELSPSDEMGFAGGHLFALDYMWDKQSVRHEQDFRAVWKMSLPDGNHVHMNLWMKGYPGREIFSIKCPPTKAFREGQLSYPVRDVPFLTIAARQHGEAWNRPFAAIYEPTVESEGSAIRTIESFEAPGAPADFVGLIVRSKNGRRDYIFSSTDEKTVSYKGMSVSGTYALVSEQENDFMLFLGNGKSISAKGYTLNTQKPANVVLEYRNGDFYLACEDAVTIITPKGRSTKFENQPYKKIKL